MTTFLAAALAAALAVPVPVDAAKPAPADEDAGSRVTDPDMVKELAAADSSNLENALSHGRADAGRAAGWLLALAASTRERVEALKTETDGGYAGDTAPLQERVSAFRKAAADMGLKLPDGSADALVAQRRAYPAKDRARDLKLAGDWVKKAGAKAPKVRLDGPGRTVSSAAAAVAEESTRLVKQALKLEARHAAGRTALLLDNEALRVEVQLIEAALTLDAHDQAAFDALPPKGEAEED